MRTGPHSVMLAYQQNTGNVGYDYGQNADGFSKVFICQTLICLISSVTTRNLLKFNTMLILAS